MIPWRSIRFATASGRISSIAASSGPRGGDDQTQAVGGWRLGVAGGRDVEGDQGRGDGGDWDEGDEHGST
jgi:hypothetical protein